MGKIMVKIDRLTVLEISNTSCNDLIKHALFLQDDRSDCVKRIDELLHQRYMLMMDQKYNPYAAECK